MNQASSPKQSWSLQRKWKHAIKLSGEGLNRARGIYLFQDKHTLLDDINFSIYQCNNTFSKKGVSLALCPWKRNLRSHDNDSVSALPARSDQRQPDKAEVFYSSGQILSQSHFVSDATEPPFQIQRFRAFICRSFGYKLEISLFSTYSYTPTYQNQHNNNNNNNVFSYIYSAIHLQGLIALYIITCILRQHEQNKKNKNMAISNNIMLC